METTVSSDFSAWIGRTDKAEDRITDRLVREFEATLSPHLAPAGDLAPLMTHWCLAPAAVGLSQLGPDGHPKRGGFLPPIPLPRRMWAGGEVSFLGDLRVGDHVTRTSTIARVERKQGRAGDLWFVDVAHEIATSRGLAIKDIQTLVYRNAEGVQRSGPDPSIAASASDMTEAADTSTVRLFRYSALTFNGHRIHYDEPYATDIENYAGLVVHGPLQATLLVHLAARLKGKRPAHFRYRGTSPLIAGPPMEMRARGTAAGADACICDANGRMTMEASLTW